MRKDPKRKYLTGKPDSNERIYYHFKLDPSRYMLYDSELGEPVEFGSFNKVATVIKNLSKECIIFYFELNSEIGWKCKRVYRPNSSPVGGVEKREIVKQVETAKK